MPPRTTLFLILTCWTAVLADGLGFGIDATSGGAFASSSTSCPSLQSQPGPDRESAAFEVAEPADEESEDEGSDEVGWALACSPLVDRPDRLAQRAMLSPPRLHSASKTRCQASRSPPTPRRHV